jgi:FkbM family methyltransferase
MRRVPTTPRAVGPLAVHLAEPLVVIDVGCREGEAVSWTAFEPQVRLIGFDPDPDECERLSASYDGPEQRSFVPLALGERSGDATLHMTHSPQSSSLYVPATVTIERHPQLAAHREIDRRRITVTALDSWLDATGTPLPDFLKLDVQGAELDVLRGAEQALQNVRALQVEVEFQALYRDQPLFADIDAHLCERGFVLWRLRGLRHLAIAGATPEGVSEGSSLLPTDAERQPSGGRLSWGDAIYVRDELAEGGRTPWRRALRDACVAAGLGLPELAQVSLAAAAATAPRGIQPGIESALDELRDAGTGVPDPDEQIEALGFASPARASDDALEQALTERDQARRELEQLRSRAGHRLWRQLERPLGAAGRPLVAARTRTRQWTKPRLGHLAHHPPAPIRVPRRQLRLRPPVDPPSISIVTPSYDQGRFIERTLRSVLDQGYPTLEYIVRDGGSSDETLSVLERYRDRIDGYVSEPDGGQADAINRGFAVTTGEIMGWLNSDDLLLPGALAAVSRHFARNPDTDLVYGHRILIDDRDRQIGCWIMPRHQDWTLDLADLVPQETMFWRRSAWEAAGSSLDVSYHYALDWDLLLRFRDSGARMVRLPHVLGAFRTHRDQKTTSQIDVGLAEIEQIRASRNGEDVSHSEAWRRLRPYLRRHVAHHTLHRLAMRVPGLRAQL